MSLASAAAMLKQLQAEGLDLAACIRVFDAANAKADKTNVERQSRYRAKRKAAKGSNAVTVTPVTPPNERDNLTPREVSDAEASSPQPWALPVGVSLQVWTDLMANRKRKRLTNTPTAWKSFQDDLARVASQTGIPPPELIRQCTAKGWGAIYDPREQRNEQRSMGRHQPADGLSSTARAAIAVFGDPRQQ
jgi:hypothetical protein